MELQLETTKVFTKNYSALMDVHKRFIVNQGGSRSSKTYSICQMLIVYAIQNPNKTISIVRKTFPSLRATVMRDVIEILQGLNLYSEKNHNKTENIYTFPNGSALEFFSLDDSQKVRGRKRNVLYINEANELEYEEFMQLNLRTTYKVICDFNPSDTEHWLYDLIKKPGTEFIHSTYKDNTFLEKEIVKEIEALIKVDKDYYNIYALGYPSKNTNTVYSTYQFYKELPPTKFETVLGVDFGYVDPTAIIRVDYADNQLYAKELLYESYLTTQEVIQKLKTLISSENLDINTPIICDYARPEIIEDMKRSGLNALNADKRIKEGIDSIKCKEVFIEDLSLNLKKELKNYKWKMRGEYMSDEPVDKYNHLLDAFRYAALWVKKNNVVVDVNFWDFDSF